MRLKLCLSVVAWTAATVGLAGFRIEVTKTVEVAGCRFGIVYEGKLYLCQNSLEGAKLLRVSAPHVYLEYEAYLILDKSKDRVIASPKPGPGAAWTFEVISKQTRQITRDDLPRIEKEITVGKLGSFKLGDAIPLKTMAILRTPDGPKAGCYLGLASRKLKIKGQEVEVFEPVLVEKRVDAVQIVESNCYSRPVK